MLRNPELRRALLVGGLLTFLASAAAISIWPITARARSACCAARCAK